MVNSAIKFVNSKSNLRLGGARMMGTPRALSNPLRPPPKNCLPGHLCLKTVLSTSGQPLRRRCLPKQNCSRTWIYHRPLATPLNFGTITGNNSSCSTKYLARFSWPNFCWDRKSPAHGPILPNTLGIGEKYSIGNRDGNWENFDIGIGLFFKKHIEFCTH